MRRACNGFVAQCCIEVEICSVQRVSLDIGLVTVTRTLLGNHTETEVCSRRSLQRVAHCFHWFLK